jgi:hypothetical protein
MATENKTSWKKRRDLEGDTPSFANDLEEHKYIKKKNKNKINNTEDARMGLERFDKEDAVHHPAHYNNGEIECIDAIEAMLTPEEFIGYLRGNSLKYRWRFRYKKQPVEDMMKAKWYEEKLLSFFKKINLSVEKRDEYGQKSGADG